MKSVGAYITAYKDILSLEKCLGAIFGQTYPINHLLIIDNSPQPLLLKPSFQITIEHHPRNIGVAGGLKKGIQWAIAENYDFLWTFDQDSEPSPNLLNRLVQFYDLLAIKGKKIGIIAPLPIDKITGQKWDGIVFDKYRFREKINSNLADEYYECDAVITSGSLISLKAARNVSLPDERFFIDAVDWEYCMNFRHNNYQIIVVKSIILDHRFGESHQIQIFPFKRKITIYNYSPLRYYYICRNYTYLETRLAELKYNLIKSVLRRLQFLIVLTAKITLFEPDLKIKKIRACLQGTFDGFIGRLGKTWEI
jgi:rhamnosyltransferase